MQEENRSGVADHSNRAGCGGRLSASTICMFFVGCVSISFGQSPAKLTAASCAKQDQLFAQAFDLWALVASTLVCFLLLPLALSWMKALGWWMTKPLVRSVAFAAIVGAFAFAIFCVLPILAGAHVIDPAIGLAAYSSNDVRYPRDCPDLSYQATPVLFGLLGAPRQAMIAQAPILAVAYLAGAAVFSLISWALLRYLKSRYGILAKARQ